MSKNIRYFAAVTLLMIITVLVILGRSFIYINLIDPLTRIFWLIIRLLEVIDQEVLWYVLILVVLVAALYMIPRHPEKTFRSAYPDKVITEDRLTFWRKQFQAANNGHHGRVTLQKNLVRLEDEIDELYFGSNNNEIETLTRLNHPRLILISRLNIILKVIFGRHSKLLDTELQKDISKMLDSMETRMEIRNDQRK